MGLLTPVGAFVKAAMAIIDVVKFFIQRAAQIMELVKAFTDSIKAIASGNVGAVAKSIENALGRAVPVLIGFLASLLGIGGLADRVIGVIYKIRQRIEKAITKFWTFVKSKAKGLLGKVGVGKKDKKDKKADDQRTTAEKERDLDAGIKEGTQLLRNENLNKKEVQKRLEVLEDRYDLQELKIVTDKVDADKETVHIYGKVNPEKHGDKSDRKIDEAPKRGDHIFNLGLGKSFRSLASVTNSQSSLSASFGRAANIVDAAEFHMTVKKEEQRSSAGDFNSQKFGATKARLETRMAEFIEAVNHNKPTNPSAIASLIKELIDSAVDHDAINYLNAKDKQQAQNGKNKLQEIKQDLVNAVIAVESIDERDSGQKDVEKAKQELKTAIKETQELLDGKEISRTMRLNELEALKQNMEEVKRLKGISLDEAKYYLDEARKELKEVEYFQINDKDDKELIFLQINERMADINKAKSLILQQKIK
ncbi:MAG: hypothetical protein EOO44_21015 [Flavobacterium sp.]|nr:MAG: hypothetical protein EOO44_21015 [Flavobacterium sp.]